MAFGPGPRPAAMRFAIPGMLALAGFGSTGHGEPLDGGAALGFDLGTLRQRGLGAETAAYFSAAPRFPPGLQSVTVLLNGRDLGRHRVRFDDTGKPCASAALAESIGVMLPPEADADPDRERCRPALWQSLRFDTRLQPAAGTISIVGPAESVRDVEAVDRTLRGGVGAFVNYRAFGFDSRVAGSAVNTSRFLDTEWGANVAEWAWRSRLSYSVIGGQEASRWQSGAVQKTFVAQSRTLLAGRFTTTAPLYAGIALTGLQWSADRALMQPQNFAVEGLAIGRSRVELRQNGVLIHTTYVPGGPFSLRDYPAPGPSSDLEVRVVDESGIERRTWVPSSALMLAGNRDADEGLSLAVGRLWNVSTLRSLDERPVLTASYGLRARPDLGLTVGMLAAGSYRSAAAGLNWRVTPEVTAFGQAMATQDGGSSGGSGSHKGLQASGGVSMRALGLLDMGVTANLRSRGWRILQQAAALDRSVFAAQAVRSQVSLNLSLVDGWARGLTASLMREDHVSGAANLVYSLGWGTQWGPWSVQMGISRNRSQVVADGVLPAGQAATITGVTGVPPVGAVAAVTSVYLNLSIPLGGGAVASAWHLSAGAVRQQGATVAQTVDETLAWRASVERASGSSEASRSLSAAVVPRYAAMTLAVSQAAHQQSRYGEIVGSVVATPQGVAASPLTVQDTYGLVRLGTVAGIRVDTPQGPVWSGPGGWAAVPALLPFHDSRLEVASRSVPVDVDVANGLIVTRAARGAVAHFEMDARRVRRVLLKVRDAAGLPLVAGLPVFDGAAFVGTIGSRGRVLLELKEDPPQLRVVRPPGDGQGGGQGCVLVRLLFVPPAAGDFFERGSATCELP